MMRKEILLPGLALTGGVIGAALRRWALTAAFEPDTGLAIATHPAMLALTAFTAAIVLALALLCRACPVKLADASYHKAFYAPEMPLPVISQAAAVVLGLSAILLLSEVPPLYLSRLTELELDGYVGPNQLRSFLFAAPELAQSLLGLAAAVSLFFAARGLAGEGGKLGFGTTVLLPGFYTCIWLINAYRDLATDPVILAYFWHLLAIIAVVLALYYAAGFSYQNVRPRLTLFFSLLGVFSCLTTLPDPHSLVELLALAAFLLWLTAASIALLRNLLGLPHTAPPKQAPPRPKPLPTDDEDDDVDIVL